MLLTQAAGRLFPAPSTQDTGGKTHGTWESPSSGLLELKPVPPRLGSRGRFGSVFPPTSLVTINRVASSHRARLPLSSSAALGQRQDLAGVRRKPPSPAPSSLPSPDIPSPSLTGAGTCWTCPSGSGKGCPEAIRPFPKTPECEEQFGLTLKLPPDWDPQGGTPLSAPGEGDTAQTEQDFLPHPPRRGIGQLQGSLRYNNSLAERADSPEKTTSRFVVFQNRLFQSGSLRQHGNRIQNKGFAACAFKEKRHQTRGFAR